MAELTEWLLDVDAAFTPTAQTYPALPSERVVLYGTAREWCQIHLSGLWAQRWAIREFVAQPDAKAMWIETFLRPVPA